MYNTPPVFNIYMMKLMVDWMISIGGLDELKRRNEHKASIIYDELDRSQYYTTPVDNKCRSMMVVRFMIDDHKLDEKFIREAEEHGLINLRADKNVGGMRAAIYNSMTLEGIEKLKQFMKEFAEDNPRFGAIDMEPEEFEI